MAGQVGVFHVEFGINETDLTRAIESQQYGKAIRLIRENSHTTFLDEGCYQRIPLYQCLCGVSEDGEEGFPRHLQLACMLAQYGAAVNYRVPTTFYGCEYMGPGKSSLELVVELFNSLTMHHCHGIMHSLDSEVIIGREGEPLTSHREILQTLLDVAFVLITHGGDGNTVDEHRQTLLHRTAVFSSDPRMLYLLCENTPNMSHCNIKGNSVLGALCDGFPLGVDNFLENHKEWDVDPYAQCCHLEGKAEFLDYLLYLPHVDVNHRNTLGRTALFECMARGDLENACKLLDAGCDSSIQGQVREGHRKRRSLSPLFLSLCSMRVINKHIEKYTANIPVSTHYLAHIVDKGHFSQPAIVKELHTIIDSDFPDFRHLKCLNERLIHLMFGGTSSSLRQACTRAIFKGAFLSLKSQALDYLLPNEHHRLQNYSTVSQFRTYITEIVSIPVLEELLAVLQLPCDTLLGLEVELFRQRLGSSFRQLEWFHYYDDEIDGVLGEEGDEEDEEDEDEEDSDEQNDSDLEYW